MFNIPLVFTNYNRSALQLFDIYSSTKWKPGTEGPIGPLGP